MTELNDERIERREGTGDRRTRTFDFTFEHFKWVSGVLIALMGIYVLSERRAAASDLTTAYLDKKVNEITIRVDERFKETQSSIESLQEEVKGVYIANSTVQGEVKALGERVSKAENALSVQQQAYNFNFTSRLAAVEARLGLKPSTSKE
jgi:septal ring factor EnvC (AmiA/AmiB activator)